MWFSKRLYLPHWQYGFRYPSVPGVDVYKNKEGVGTVDISYIEALDCPKP